MKNKKNFPHIHTNELSSQTKKSIWVRIVTAFIGLSFIIPCMFVGDWAFFAIVSILMSLATFEIIRAPGKSFPIAVYVLTYLLVYVTCYFGFIYVPLFSDEAVTLANAFCAPQVMLSAACSFIALFIYFVISIFTARVSLDDIFYLFTMSLLLAMGMQAAIYLRNLPIYLFEHANPGIEIDAGYRYFSSSTLIIYILLGIFMNDSGAYFIGILFGKHPMNPTISPKKTWEGFAGGLFFSIAISMSFALAMAYFDQPVLPFLDLSHWYIILIISVLNALLAVIGDLFFSLVKRHFNLKDFSNLLPGHGGFVDRLDSVIFCLLGSAIVIATTYQILLVTGQIA